MKWGDALRLDGAEKEYFYWLIDQVGGCEQRLEHVFVQLYRRNFTWSIDLDENRALDGLRLRDLFGIHISNKPCSVLEMMVALAIKEDNIMGYYISEECGPDTWFWEMMNQLGVNRKTTDRDINEAVDIVLNREYDYYGHGGLFYVPEPRKDLRKVDLWYQMQWHLAQVYMD